MAIYHSQVTKYGNGWRVGFVVADTLEELEELAPKLKTKVYWPAGSPYPSIYLDRLRAIKLRRMGYLPTTESRNCINRWIKKNRLDSVTTE